jgi:prophage antirepressor-like protein
MQYELQIFEYKDRRQFRTLEIDGEIWFFAIDVCVALDIKNPSDAYSRLDSDDLGTTEGVDERGRKQAFRIVSESGLYELIFLSRKPEAKKFKRWVTHEVLPQIRRTGGYGKTGKTPAFIQRYNANWDRVDVGYFSVISELTIRVWGRLELVGHVMADRAPDGKEIRPDVAVGIRFAAWLDKNHPAVCKDYKTYIHDTPEWRCEARQYPVGLLPLFIEYVDTVWIPEHAGPYLRSRDPAALAYLPKLLPANDRKPLPRYKKSA